MPLTVSELKEKTATIDVYKELGRHDLAGQLNVKVRLYSSNTEAAKKAARMYEDDDLLGIVDFGIDEALKQIVSWDFLDKPEDQGGQPIPISRESLEQVPDDILEDIGAAIREYKHPNRKSAGGLRRR